MGVGGEVSSGMSSWRSTEKVMQRIIERKKKSCTTSSLEKRFLHTEKKYSCKGNVNKKIGVARKSPLTFLMVRPLPQMTL